MSIHYRVFATLLAAALVVSTPLIAEPIPASSELSVVPDPYLLSANRKLLAMSVKLKMTYVVSPQFQPVVPPPSGPPSANRDPNLNRPAPVPSDLQMPPRPLPGKP